MDGYTGGHHRGKTMYAITSISSSTAPVPSITADVQTQLRNFAEPQLAPSKLTAIADNPSISAVDKTGTSNSENKPPPPPPQDFSKNQQKKINEFNLVMLEQSPQNSSASINNNSQPQSSNANLQVAKNPIAASKPSETPYMVIMINQTFAYIQKLMNSVDSKPPPEKPEPITQS